MPSVFALLGACGGTSSQGSLQVNVSAPSDGVLSPLKDPRLSSMELRVLGTGEVLGRAVIDASHFMNVSLGEVPVGKARDLSLVALGSAGQQVLGLGIARNQAVTYGSQQSIAFNMRRPLFFFGGSAAFTWFGGTSPATWNNPNDFFGNPNDPTNPDLALLANKQLYSALSSDNTFLRVLDPNSGEPLLNNYALQLPPSVAASVGTSDGLSLVAMTLAGSLHFVDTSTFKSSTASSFSIPGHQPPAGAMVVDSSDQMLAVLNFNHFDSTPPTTGVVGSITAVRNLSALRGGSQATPDVINLNVMPDAGGPPIAAAFAPNGLLDVVFGPYPVAPGQPDCGTLGRSMSTLRSYDLTKSQDGTEGAYQVQPAQPYTTGIVYSASGQRVLVQPCATPMNALRPGQVVIQAGGGNPALVLPAPGTAAVAVAGQPSALVAVGRDEIAVDPTNMTPAQGAVRVLVPDGWKGTNWTTTSTFALDDLEVPQIFPTPMGTGLPQPDTLQVQLKARDLLIYQIKSTPDQARAVVAARITYQTSAQGVFLGSFATMTGGGEDCYMHWSGYTYHVFLMNLQTGAREQDWMVGIQNTSCNATLMDRTTACPSYCDPIPPGAMTVYSNELGLSGFQQGYIPTAVSALFSGQ